MAAELTLEQQKAIATANARRRMSESSGDQSGARRSAASQVELAPEQSMSEQFGEYLFGPTDRQEYSLTEAAEAGGLGAAAAYAGPKLLKYGGKAVKMIPTTPTRVVGGLMEAGGEALEKVPVARRLLAGGSGGVVGGITEQTGEYLGMPRIVTLPASVLTGSLGGYTTDLLSRATGLEAKALAKELREKGIQLTEDMLRKTGMTQSEAQSELARLQRIQMQLANREQVATERVAGRQAAPMASERQAVLEDVARARVAAQNEARIAGDTAEQAASRVAQAEQNVLKAESAVNALEQQMLSAPSINKETFGKQLQTTTKKLYDDLVKLRKEAAPFKDIIEKAGNAPTVSTEAMYSDLTRQINQTRNPTTRNILSSIRSELIKDNEKKFSLADADSLKGYIDNIINSKQFGDTKLDKEILNQVRKVKGGLFNAIREPHPEYLQAMGAFRTASRPLDIVERNGALAKVIEQDPLSTAYVMQEAEVVGKIIAKAKAGNKVFERLIENNPDIKNSAKLYFTKDLFGKETAPTEDALRTWLKNNESVLNRIGIYDDFKNLRVARTTAKQAVDNAKGVVAEAKDAYGAAKKTATEAENRAKSASSLQERAATRLEETLGAAEPVEKILQRGAARAKPAETRVAQEVGKVEKTIEQQEAITRRFELLQDDLKRIPAKEIPNEVKKLADKLATEGNISTQEAESIKRQVDLNLSKFKNADDAWKSFKRIAIGLGLTGAAGAGYRFVTPSSPIGYN
jgi:hypothetical protein